MLISFFLITITSNSVTVPGQPSPRFHVEAWLPFRNCEMDYSNETVFNNCVVGLNDILIMI